MDDRTVELGAFRLEERIGRGAMGEVWRAAHVHNDHPAAIKVITGSHAFRADYRKRFRNEIRSVASLNHPGIVQVYDYGEVTHEVAGATGMALRAESPYFAMELADGGSLDELESELGWARLRDVLVGLLEALGHAHARGIVHRDLKPSNLMRTTDPAGRDQYKITDFGLAFDRRYALRDDPSDEDMVGTPKYMAPEQLRSRWRDVGPWTDLYAVGCTVWRLATGEPPYDGDALLEIAQKHLQQPLPEFEPRFSVPDGLEPWLARLLEKPPHDRYRCAADALWALMEMPDRVDAPDSAEVDLDDQPTVTRADITRPLEETALDSSIEGDSSLDAPETAVDYAPEDVEPADFETDAAARERPPVPETWRQRRGGLEPAVTAGRELFSLQEIPTVGRREERDRIWETLTEVAEQRTARVLLFRGSAGVGKSRLARWVRERAAELGVANSMVAPHDDEQPPFDALAQAVTDYTNCQGLDRERIAERLERWFRAREVDRREEWRSMTELLANGVSPDPDRSPDLEGALDREQLGRRPTEPSDDASDASRPKQFSSAQEIRALLRRFLETAARERPLVVQLDDLQWGPETMRFLDYLLDGPYADDLPVLFVGTVRDDLLAERPTVEALVESTAELDAASELQIGPMSEEGQLELVEELLHLTPKAARRVVDRASGNPMFAVELVRDWIDRDILEATDRGFALAEGADAPVPDDVYEVWRRRLDEVLEGVADDARAALQVAATLGEEIDDGEWRTVCDELGVEVPESLAPGLADHNLLVETEDGWRLSHTALRETLVRRAKEEGRWTSLNETCAEVLEAGDDPEALERRARHLRAAGDREAAAGPLLEAARRQGKQRKFHRAHRLFDRAEECLDAELLEERPALASTYHYVRGRLEVVVAMDLEAALEAFEHAVERSREAAGWRPEARGLLGAATAHAKLGHAGEALELALCAEEICESRETPEYCRAKLRIGGARRALGEFEGAESAYEDLRRIAAEIGAVDLFLTAYRTHATLHNHLKESEAVFEVAGRAHRLAREVGHMTEAARTANILGNAALRAGDLDRAETWFRRAEHFTDLVDSPLLFSHYLGRVEVELERDAPRRALDLLEDIRRCTRSRDTGPHFRVAARGLEAAARACAGDWSAASDALEELESLLDKHPRKLPGVAEYLEAAAATARGADRNDLAGRLESACGRLAPESPADDAAE